MLLGGSALSYAQSRKSVIWESEKNYLEYQKQKDYKGPEDWYGSYPADMQDKDYGAYSGGRRNSSERAYQGIQYSPQKIRQDRQKRYGRFDRGSGDVPFDPEVERPDPIELPEIDTPDIDPPDVDINPPTIPMSFWKVLLFIIIATIVLVVVYLLVKNRKPSVQKVLVDVEDDWNPEVVTKTELEVRLEAAMEKDNYRECVRIYFTFILKELIRKSWIQWKREKTNYRYLLEMQQKPNVAAFAECIRIYDLVWYGEYAIDEEVFGLLKPTLEAYYKSLDPVDE